MKTLLSLLTVAALTITGLVVSFAPATCAEAGLLCAPSFLETPMDIGTGSSCSAATSSLEANLATFPQCAFGICEQELVIVEPCKNLFGNLWITRGKLKYKCIIDF